MPQIVITGHNAASLRRFAARLVHMIRKVFLDAFCAEIVSRQLSNWHFRFFRGIQFSSAGIFLQRDVAPGQPNFPGQFGRVV